MCLLGSLIVSFLPTPSEVKPDSLWMMEPSRNSFCVDQTHSTIYGWVMGHVTADGWSTQEARVLMQDLPLKIYVLRRWYKPVKLLPKRIGSVERSDLSHVY